MAYPYGPQQVWQPYPMRTSAPVSLHVVAIFQYLGGLVSLAGATVLGLAAVDAFPRLEYQLGVSTYTTRPADITVIVAVVCAVLALVGIVAIVLGRKVQRGRNWARIVLTGLNVLSIAATVFQIVGTGDRSAPTLVGLAFPVLFVLLLNTRAARSWCRHRTW